MKPGILFSETIIKGNKGRKSRRRCLLCIKGKKTASENGRGEKEGWEKTRAKKSKQSKKIIIKVSDVSCGRGGKK